MARLLRNSSFLRSAIFPESCRKSILGTQTQVMYFSSKGKKKSKSDESDSGEENLSKKDLALKQALDQITTSFGKGSIMWLGRSTDTKHVPVVSTGSFSLDMALGIGGFPKGRVVEIYGPEASGKTTLALHVIAEAQKQGGYCVFVDAEHALDPALATAIGVNTSNLLLSQPDCGEQALSLVDTLIRSGSVDVVVVDSVAALVPKGELDGEMGDAHMAMQARLMSQALRKLSHSLSMSQTVLVFINQVRAKLSTFGFGGPTEVTCGGNALKFYASVRLNIRRIGFVKKGEETIGSQVRVKIVKNKHAPPFRTAEFELEFGKGISLVSELVELGLKHKFITKAGGSYYRMNEDSFHGKDALKRHLAGNDSVRKKLKAKLTEKLLHVEELGKENESTDAEGVLQVDIVEDVIASDTADEEVVIEHVDPTSNIVRAYVDAVWKSDSCLAGFGAALFREDDKSFEAWVSPKSVASSVFTAEAQAVQWCLSRSLALGIKKLICYTDNQLLALCIQLDRPPPIDSTTVLEDIRRLISSFDVCTISHISRDNNKLAHRLAAYSFASDVGLYWHDCIPV